MKSELISDMFSEKREKVPVRKIAKAGVEKIAEEKIIKKDESEAEEKKPQGFFVNLFGWIVLVSIFMVFLGIPVFFTGFSFQGIAFEKQMYFYFWTLLALVAWASKGVLAESLRIRKTPLDIPILIFWIVYAASTVFSIDRWHSFWGWFGDPSRGLLGATAIIIFYYIFTSNYSRKMFNWNMVAFFVSGLAVSAISALKFFHPQFFPAAWLEVVPLSLLGSVRSIAMLFGIMLLLAITFVMKLRSGSESRTIWKNILTGFILTVIVGELILIWTAEAYVGWIGLFLGIFLFLVFTLSKFIKSPENWTWLLMAVFVVLIVIKLVGPVGLFNIDLPMETSPSHKVSWEVAKNSIKEKMILGSGPATYGYDFSLHQPENFNLSFLKNLRFYGGTGTFMETVSSMGIVGSIALVILTLSFISIIFYLLKHSRDGDKTYSLGFMSVAAMVLAGSLISQIDGPTVLLGALVIILALAVIYNESGIENSFYSLTLKASAKFALTMAFVFMLVSAGVVFLFIFIGRAYTADVYAYLGVRGIQSGDAKSIEKIDKAVKTFGNEGSYYTLAGQEYMLLANNENSKNSGNSDAIAGYASRAMENSKKGSDLMPNDVQAAEALAQVYENLGIYGADTFPLAEEKYKQALELEPHNPNFYLKLGQIKLNQAVKAKQAKSKDQKDDDENTRKLVQEAKDLFQKSIEQKSNFSAGFFYVAQADEALGQIGEAVGDMEKAISFEAGNANYIFNLGRLYQARGEEGDYEKAEVLFKKLLAAKIDEANVRFSLGALYEKMNRKDESLAEYKKVLELLPAENAEARKKVNDAISGTGNNSPAVPENTELTGGENGSGTGAEAEIVPAASGTAGENIKNIE